MKRLHAARLVILRPDGHGSAEGGQDGKQVRGERRAALGVVPGHEDIAGDAAGAAHLIAGNEDGVPFQGRQPGRLFGRPPADHLGREIEQFLDRDGGADVDSRFLFGDPSQFRNPGNIDQKLGLLLLIDSRGGVAEDELDLLASGLSDELFLEPVDLRKRTGPIPLMAAAGEMEGPRRRAGGGKQVQVDAGELTPALDREGGINQAFLSLVLAGIVVVGEGPHRMKNRAVARAATEIAAKNVLDLLLGRCRLLLQKSVRIHDEPGRAKAALRAVVRRDAVLGRIQLVMDAAYALGGRHHHAIDRAQRP